MVGSPYLRQLGNLGGRNHSRRAAAAGTILYAGLAPVFFPRELEIAAVDRLADFQWSPVNAGKWPIALFA